MREAEGVGKILAHHIQQSQSQLAQEHSCTTVLEETIARHVQELEASGKVRDELTTKVAGLKARLAKKEQQLQEQGQELQKARNKIVEVTHMVKLARERESVATQQLQ